MLDLDEKREGVVPRDAATRYAQESDFDDWGARLEIFGLDLRHTPSVEAFCTHLLDSRERLDFIISNACQTVRRPPGFYRHMLEAEQSVPDGEVRMLLGRLDGVRRQEMLPATNGIASAAELTQVALLPDDFGLQDFFFEGRLDKDL